MVINFDAANASVTVDGVLDFWMRLRCPAPKLLVAAVIGHDRGDFVIAQEDIEIGDGVRLHGCFWFCIRSARIFRAACCLLGSPFQQRQLSTVPVSAHLFR